MINLIPPSSLPAPRGKGGREGSRRRREEERIERRWGTLSPFLNGLGHAPNKMKREENKRNKGWAQAVEILFLF